MPSAEVRQVVASRSALIGTPGLRSRFQCYIKVLDGILQGVPPRRLSTRESSCGLVKGHNEKIDVGFRRSVIDDSGANDGTARYICH